MINKICAMSDGIKDYGEKAGKRERLAVLFYFILLKYILIVDLQCCINFCYTAK